MPKSWNFRNSTGIGGPDDLLIEELNHEGLQDKADDLLNHRAGAFSSKDDVIAFAKAVYRSEKVIGRDYAKHISDVVADMATADNSSLGHPRKLSAEIVLELRKL